MAKTNRKDWAKNGVPEGTVLSETGRPKATTWAKDSKLSLKNEKGEEEPVFVRSAFVLVREDKETKTADYAQVRQYKTDSYDAALKIAGKNNKRNARLLCKGINGFAIDKAKKTDSQRERMAKIVMDQKGISIEEARKAVSTLF